MFVISSLRPGYVEQRDMHMPLATVRESLLFSATLRLPRSVTEEQRRAFVEEIIDILELRPLADRIVGNGQKKNMRRSANAAAAHLVVAVAWAHAYLSL